MPTQVRSTYDFGGGPQTVTGISTPSASSDAVPKSYVDGIKAGMDWKDSVRAASTASVTTTAPGAAIDGVTLAAGDRVLLKDQSTASQNGLWVWNGAAVAMTRATDADANAEVTSGLTVAVTEGTINGDSVWMLTTNDPIVVATTGLSFTQIGTIVNAGTGLSKSGNTISLVVPVTVALGGTGATTQAAAQTNLAIPRTMATDIGGSTSMPVVHGFGTTDVGVDLWNKSTGADEEADIVRTDANTVTIGFASAPGASSYRVMVTAKG